MNYIFGKFIHESQIDIKSVVTEASSKTKSFAKVDIYEVLNVLSRLETLWKNGAKYHQKALELLKTKNTYSMDLNRISLEVLCSLVNRENLKSRLESEFKNIQCLNTFSPLSLYKGKIYYRPLGTLLHITAGNVFLGAIDSLLMGLLTKNVSLVKLSSCNGEIPLLFMESLIEADTEGLLVDKISLLKWKGGNQEIESYLKKNVDGIITWGGEDMVNSYKANLGENVKLINHGPKISFHVISEDAYNNGFVDFDALATDICLWEQRACANSQNIFLENGININEFNSYLAKALKNYAYSRSDIDENEQVELLKDYFLGIHYEFQTGIRAIREDEFQIVGDHNILNPSSLNRCIKVKSYNSVKSLTEMLSQFSFYLQTCGLSVMANEVGNYKKELALCGVNRITDPGSMLSSLDGSPHDGQYSLQELTVICADETSDTINHFLFNIDTPFYDAFKGKGLESYPLLSGEEIAQFGIHKDRSLLNRRISEGLVFSSGGTSGSPKYALYAGQEFRQIANLLGQSYLDNGLNPGEHVANLFMAGNMWSSFSAIQYALEYCKVVQFPMGAQMKAGEIAKVIGSFQIKTLFGLPGLLLQLAQEQKHLSIDRIFYAGEHFSKDAMDYLTQIWGVKEFISAGYACVDVGPIGYQTKDCLPGEHYLFDGIHLEIIDEEAVITSTIRTAMPVIRYKTGDRVRIISKNQGLIKFKLLGRVDSKINIWSSRFELSEIREVLMKLGHCEDFQVVLRNNDSRASNKGADKLILRLGRPLDREQLLTLLYEQLTDLNQTQSYDFFEENTYIQLGQFDLSPKTGKFKILCDERSY